MNENLKTQDLLLVKEKDKYELKAVSGMDKDGKVKQSKPKNGDNPDFLKINKHGNILENFFENFMRQAKNPTQFEFFRVPSVKLQEIVQKLQEAFRNPDNPENKDFIDKYRIEPEAFLKKQAHIQEPAQPKEQTPASNHALDANCVDWAQLERIGVSRETLEKTGDLDKLLNRLKTNLIPISIKSDGITVRTDARLALRESSDGSLSVVVHALRKKPELGRPYFGIKFTEDDKKNLLATGNLGRIVEAEFKQGEKTPVLISVDRQTNELVAVRADTVKISDNIKGLQLNEHQKKELSEGKAVWLEGMTAKNGKEFSAFLQFNADKRGLEFRFDNEKQPEQSQKRGNAQNEAPKTFRKKELTEDQRVSISEGKTVYVDGLIDKRGKKYSGYITLNKETGKTDFMFSKDYKEALAAGRIIPDNRHKIQVAVNSEGKTSEATKNIKEPLKQGQAKPTEKQAAKQEREKLKSKKSTSIKM